MVRTGRVAALGLAIVGALVMSSAVSAAPEQQTYTISGTIFVQSPPALVLPAGSTFTATIDTTTGAITNGVTSIPTFDRGAVPPADITITDAAPATGTLDPVTGAATLNASYTITIAVPLLGAVCTLGPVNVAMSTANPGGVPFTGTPLTGTVTAAGFSVPGVVVSATCPPGTDAAVNATVGIPSTNTTMALTVSRAPAPVVARARFTG